MAQNASDHINYFLLLDGSRKDDLAVLRTWSNLKVAVDAEDLWVKDLDFAQINSLEVKSLLFRKRYYEKSGKLFPLNSILPECNVPGLLWTSIDRVFHISLSGYNHNYFGVDQHLTIRLQESSQEREAEVMVTTIPILKKYIESAPAIRLLKLKWTILNNDKVLIIGTPVLPLNGEIYWRLQDSIIPVGYQFELHLLHKSINDKVNPDHHCFVVWHTDGTYALVEKDKLVSLSLSSFRSSMLTLPLNAD